jgi:hypothetical protein
MRQWPVAMDRTMKDPSMMNTDSMMEILAFKQKAIQPKKS